MRGEAILLGLYLDLLDAFSLAIGYGILISPDYLKGDMAFLAKDLETLIGEALFLDISMVSPLDGDLTLIYLACSSCSYETC